VFPSVSDRALYQLNMTEPFPHTQSSFDFLKSGLESHRAGVSNLTFADVSRKPFSVLSGVPASDRTSKVARITELSQTIQSRLRGPMQQLEKHLECKFAGFCFCVFFLELLHDICFLLVLMSVSSCMRNKGSF